MKSNTIGIPHRDRVEVGHVVVQTEIWRHSVRHFLVNEALERDLSANTGIVRCEGRKPTVVG